MRELRPRKPDDQENITQAFNLIQELMDLNPQVEPTLWASAITSILIKGYINCGYSYEEFREEMNNAFEHYEEWFDQK